MKPTKRDVVTTDLVDKNVKTFEGKGGTKLKAQKHVYNFTVRELYREFNVRYSQFRISSTLFFRCKPFYVSPATERKMEYCLCAKCSNPHTLYSALRRHMKDLPAWSREIW